MKYDESSGNDDISSIANLSVNMNLSHNVITIDSIGDVKHFLQILSLDMADIFFKFCIKG